MVFRNFIRQVRNGFRNLFRNGWMTTASILLMTLALFTIGALLFIMSNVDNITTDIEEGINIRVHIELTATPEDELELQDTIEAIDGVSAVTYRSKDEELQDLVDSIEEFELVFGDNNPLYNVLLVSVEDSTQLEQIAQQIRALPYATEVTYGELDTENLIRLMTYLRVGMALVASIFTVISLLIISNTIRLTIRARQTEIEIMQLVGASRSYVRRPFLYEGAFIGIIGSILASAFVYAAYNALQNTLLEYANMRIIQLTPMWPMMGYITLTLVVAGILIGMYGARRSVNQLIR